MLNRSLVECNHFQKMKINTNIILTIFWLFIRIGYSQNINNSIWASNIQIVKTQKSYLIIKYIDPTGKLISTSRSENISLNAGINNLSFHSIKTIKTEFFDKAAERSIATLGILPEGTYEICVTAYAVGTDEDLGRDCHTGTIVYSEADKKLIQSSGLSSSIKPFGSASLNFFSTSPRQAYTELPASYLRVQADPGFSIYGIPIAGQFRYTTEKVGPYSELDLFTLKVDRSQWEQKIKSMVLSRIASSQLAKAKEYQDILVLLKDRDQLESRLKEKGTDYIQKQIERVRDSIAQIKNKIIDAGEEKLSELQQVYKGLIAKKNQVDRVVDRYRQLDALKKKWLDSGKLDELKKLAEDPPDLSDPKILLSQLKGLGALTGINKFLFNVKEISIGTAFPVYSPLTLNGTQILGGNLEWNPGLFTLAATGGKVQNPYLALVDSNAIRYGQQVAALRLGIGKTYGTYLSFNALHFWDRASSIDIPRSYEIFPQASSVGSMDFAVSIGKKRYFELSAELAGLFKNQNTSDTKSPIEIPEEVPTVLIDALHPNLSSNADFAFNGSSHINLFDQKTRLSATAHYAGPGYLHPGTYGIQNDLFKQGYRLEQTVLHRKLRLAAFYNTDYDNFSGAKGLRTYRSDIGGEININAQKSLSATARFSTQHLDNSVFHYQSTVANLLLNKSIKISSTTYSNTTLSGMYFFTKTDSIANNIQSFYAFLQQSLTLRGGWSINLSGQAAINKSAALNNLTSGISGNISKTLFKKIRLAGGARYMDTPNAQNFGFTFDLTGDIAKNLSLNFRAFKNDYTRVLMGVVPGGEVVVQSGIKYVW